METRHSTHGHHLTQSEPISGSRGLCRALLLTLWSTCWAGPVCSWTPSSSLMRGAWPLLHPLSPADEGHRAPCAPWAGSPLPTPGCMGAFPGLDGAKNPYHFSSSCLLGISWGHPHEPAHWSNGPVKGHPCCTQVLMAQSNFAVFSLSGKARNWVVAQGL